MWFYRSPIGILRIVPLNSNGYFFLFGDDPTPWTATPTRRSWPMMSIAIPLDCPAWALFRHHRSHRPVGVDKRSAHIISDGLPGLDALDSAHHNDHQLEIVPVLIGHALHILLAPVHFFGNDIFHSAEDCHFPFLSEYPFLSFLSVSQPELLPQLRCGFLLNVLNDQGLLICQGHIFDPDDQTHVALAVLPRAAPW